MTPDELRAAQHAHIAAQQHADTARAARNHAIRTALEAGWTHKQIAEYTGLTRGRIGQLTPNTAQRKDAS